MESFEINFKNINYKMHTPLNVCIDYNMEYTSVSRCLNTSFTVFLLKPVKV